MATSAAKISELPFHLHTSPFIPHLPSRSSLSFHARFRLLFCRAGPPRTADQGGRRRLGTARPRRYPWDDGETQEQPPPSSQNPDFRRPRSPRPSHPPWLQRWTDPSPPRPQSPTQKSRRKNKEEEQEPTKTGSIERIVHRLRNLGLDKDDGDENSEVDSEREEEYDLGLGDLLERSWNRPDSLVHESDSAVLPWEREGDGGEEVELGAKKERRAKAPTMAELTIEDAELRRLRRLGIQLRERVSVPKAGVTQAIQEKMHDAWRKGELVRLKFHESLTHDMKTAHEIVERRTGGLVIWRSGSIMVVYRGSSYKRPSKSALTSGQSSQPETSQGVDAPLVPDVSSSSKPNVIEGSSLASSPLEMHAQSHINDAEEMTEEERECDQMLNELGPRFIDWWGTGILPVDADLLPQTISGYQPPFRLLPTGMRSRLTNAEMTNLRKLARTLPSHFALGRNRNHQGLAAAILKLWENSVVVKIAVKRGIQNTNNKIMAEELKNLTGGVLLLRNKFYIVFYRGKDFLPTSVAVALAERQEQAKNIHDLEEMVRIKNFHHSDVQTSLKHEEKSKSKVKTEEEEASCSPIAVNGHALAGTLAEFLEAEAQWGRQISVEEQEQMKQEASRMKIAKMVKKLEHKLSLAEAKKMRAEKLLAKIESSMVPLRPSDDFETISEEERSVFRRIGLKMKAYLPLGIRGVFDGVIENMHLHWKHRELVKLISKQKTLAFVEDSARLLEYESGGILVAIERVPKGYALIYYRGKNYQRPINLRPRNLLTKAKALKRSVAMQRHEALSQHILELEKSVEKIKSDLGDSKNVDIGKVISPEAEWNMNKDMDFDSLSEEDDDNDDDEYDDDEKDEDDFYDSEEDDE
ncbi:CRS1 / YhbY (CRM) domain-containing protein [Wolffia australiana]